MTSDGSGSARAFGLALQLASLRRRPEQTTEADRLRDAAAKARRDRRRQRRTGRDQEELELRDWAYDSGLMADGELLTAQEPRYGDYRRQIESSAGAGTAIQTGQFQRQRSSGGGNP